MSLSGARRGEETTGPPVAVAQTLGSTPAGALSLRIADHPSTTLTALPWEYYAAGDAYLRRWLEGWIIERFGIWSTCKPSMRALSNPQPAESSGSSVGL